MKADDKRLKNLTPYPKGVSGNPAGRKKGSKNWSTLIQDILTDEKLLDSISSKKPSYYESLPQKNAASAIAVVMVIAAIKGDHRAAEWLRKTGYGDKLKLDTEDGLFQTTKIEVEIVKSKFKDVGNSESELSDSE